MKIVSDPYRDYDRFYFRLKDEYDRYGELIIAVDFDDTVFNTHDNPGWCYHEVIKMLLRWQDHAKIVCWTASNEDRYDFIRSVFTAHGVRLDAINENVNGIERRGPKIYANVYIDDRSGGIDNVLKALDRLALVSCF